MKTLNVSISDAEFAKFGLKKARFAFADLVEMIRKEIALQTLNKCVDLSEKYGLSKMTMGQINKEVNALRKNAKSNR